MAPQTQERIDVPTRSRRLDMAMLAAGIASLSLLYSTQAVLPSISHELGIHAAAASLTVSAATGALALAVLPISSIAETVGRAKVMSIALIVGCVCTVLTAVAPDLWLMLVARALCGVALAGVVAVAMGHVGDEAEPSRVSASMGIYIAGTTLGGLVGRLLPAGAIDLVGWRGGVALIAGVAALATIAFMIVLPPARRFEAAPASLRHHLAAIGGHLRHPGIRRLCLTGFLLMGGFVATYNFLGFRLIDEPFDLPKSAVGLVFIAYLAGTLSSTLAGRLVTRFGRAPLLLASIATSMVGLALTLSSSLAVVIVGLVIFTTGFFAAHAVASGGVVALASGSRSQASALYLVSYYLGSSVVGALAGFAWIAGGWLLTVGCVAALFVGAAVVVATGARRLA